MCGRHSRPIYQMHSSLPRFLSVSLCGIFLLSFFLSRWRHFETVIQLETFISSLAKRGMREKALKEVLEGQKSSIISSIKK